MPIQQIPQVKDFIPGKTACIHLIHPHPAGKIDTNPQTFFAGLPVQQQSEGGVFDIACTPGSRLPTHATDQVVAVTCPACKETEVFKQIAAEQLGASFGDSEADQKIAAKVVAAAKAAK